MYKHLIITLFAVLFCKGLLAQTTGSSGFRLYERSYKVSIGPKVGVGMAFGTPVPMYDYKASMGMSFQAGMAVNAHFGRRQGLDSGRGGTGWFGMEAEALYSMRNLKLNETAVRMNCVEIPLLVQLYFIPEMCLETGLTMVKVLGFTPDIIQSDYALLHTGQIKGNDVMLTAGLCFKAGGIMMDLRYNKGMSGLAGNLDAKVSSVILSVAYLIDIVK